MTYHELNLFCLQLLKKKKYQQHFQDILEILNFLTNKNINNNDLVISRNTQLEINISKFKKILLGVVAGKPLVRYTQKLNWKNLDLFIDKNVFIPRKETELLIDVAADVLKKIKTKRIIYDVCSGSGCIAISLKKMFKNLIVYASDISIKAVENIKINSRLNNVEVNYLRSNLLAHAIKNKIKIFMLTCNPPYIDVNEKLNMSVIKNDPHNALFAKNDGYFFYEKIAEQIKNCIFLPESIIFEIGINQEKKITEIFSNLGYYCKIYSDFNNINRILKFTKK